MEKVAHFIQQAVISKAAPDDAKDEYARTTFNRYYYAAFHAARDFLKVVSPEISQLGHGDFPNFLRRTIRKRYSMRLDQGWRTNLISDKEFGKLESLAKGSIEELARLLESAYAVRVRADYQLEVRVKFRDGGYSLAGTDIKEAANWPSRARFFRESLKNIWVQIGD